MIAIIVDGWTAKSSIYAFAGLIGCWIDREWLWHEHVLDLLTLEGDHSGASYGKAVFKAIQKRGITDKLSTSCYHPSIDIPAFTELNPHSRVHK